MAKCLKLKEMKNCLKQLFTFDVSIMTACYSKVTLNFEKGDKKYVV